MQYKIITTFIISAILAGIAVGQITYSSNFFYETNQRITGEGFFSSYHEIATYPIDLSKRGYGSGSYNDESTIIDQNGVKRNGEDYVSTANNISYTETVDFAYGEKTLNLGKSFSSAPIRTLEKDETRIKNYEEGISMDALFDSASVLSKDLSTNMYWSSGESGTKDDPTEEYSLEQNGLTNLNVAASFTGKGHIGALVTNDTSPKGINHNANVATLIDEDYLGTYALSKNMLHEFNNKYTREIDEELPCCFGGWEDMNYYDTKGMRSAKSLFDCTCYKIQKTAQFPELTEAKAW